MARRPTVMVQLDAELVREARKILGARSNRQTVELAMTIALSIRSSGGAEAAKYLETLRTDRFKI